jgi:hypothetical protein
VCAWLQPLGVEDLILKKPHALILLLAATGSAIGVMVAIVGLPYGRLDYTAFAHVYQNGGTTFLTVQMNVDCNTASPGIQTVCTIPTTSLAPIPLDVIITNQTGAGTQIDQFNYDLYNDECFSTISSPASGSCFNGNTSNPAGGIGPSVPVPDSTNFPPNYDCNVISAKADAGTGAPGTSTSFLTCAVQSGSSTALPNGASLRLSGENFSDNVTAATTIVLTLSNVAASDDNGVTTITCAPAAPPPASPEGNVSGPCFPATLNFVVPPPATDTPVPPTNTPAPSTATPTATPSSIDQNKTCATADGRLNTYKLPEAEVAGNTNASGNECNLFICVAPNGFDNCAAPGEGDLVVIEQVINVSPGLGAYEFNVEFDSFVIQSVNPSDVVFSSGGAGAARPADCSISINFENSVRFGCVTTGSTPPGPTGSFDLAKLDLIPAADDVKDLFPGNNNGIPTLIKDNQCELADVLGHPLPGAGNGSGQLGVCGDLLVTVRILEGDLNLDCRVDVLDEAIIAAHYGAFFGSAFYNKWFDLEPSFHDLDIDIKDVQKVFGRDGSTCADPIPQQTPVPASFPLNS